MTSPNSQDLTTLICLFHSRAHAHAALEDLLKAGIPEPNITLIDNDGSQIAANGFSLEDLNVPAKDRGHLLDGIQAGGAVLTVSSLSSMADKVDEIFKNHSASKIDEDVVDDDMSGVNPLAEAPLGEAGTTTHADSLAAADAVTNTGEVLLVEDELTGTTYVYTVRPVAQPAGLENTGETYRADEDVDPRELGLDSRMAPTGSTPRE